MRDLYSISLHLSLITSPDTSILRFELIPGGKHGIIGLRGVLGLPVVSEVPLVVEEGVAKVPVGLDV